MSHVLAFVIGVGGGYMLAEWIRQAGASRRDALLSLLGVLILLLVAYATWTSYANAAELARVAECQRVRNAEFSDAIRARWQAADRENAAAIEHTEAIEDFLDTVRGATGPNERQAAFDAMYAASETYAVALRELNAVRLQNPLNAEECR